MSLSLLIVDTISTIYAILPALIVAEQLWRRGKPHGQTSICECRATNAQRMKGWLENFGTSFLNPDDVES